jgi:hypothetical protein
MKLWGARAIAVMATLILLFLVQSDPERVLTTVGKDVQNQSDFGEQTKLCETINSGEPVVISGEFDYFPSKNNQNLFQTADLNLGIRLEISLSDELALVIGTPSGEISEVLKMRQRLVAERKYNFAIVLENKRAILKINEITIKESEKLAMISCSHLIIGSGYDESRIFAGNYKISIAGNLIQEKRKQAMLLILVIFLLGSLAWLVHEDEQGR